MAEGKKIATGYIGNALRSAADNHTTTFADEIFDTERQKYQNEVNADLEATDNEIKADLAAETARAKAAEEANTQSITDEVARATAAEEVNAQAIVWLEKEIGSAIADVSFENQKYSSDLMPTLLKAGVKYYLKVNNVSDNTRIGVSIENADNSDNKFIGNIEIGGSGIVIIPETDKAKIRTTLVDVESGNLSYTVYMYGMRQEIDEQLLVINDRITTNKTNIDKNTEGLAIGDSRLNTIFAEQGYVEKVFKTQTGKTLVADIQVSVSKGEVFLVKADWGDNVNDTSVAITINGSNTAIVYANKGQWTLIKPSENVVKVTAKHYLSFVVGDGDYSLSIKKLQAITTDGKLPLYDGGLLANGDTFSNDDRKTTRVILNDAPLYLYLSDGYQVNYMYGNEPDNLFDGSYISALNGGGETILNVDAKYIGFTIVKPSAATFDDLMFIVANKDSNDAKISKIVNSIGGNTDLYPFVQGTRDKNGVLTAATNRITSQIIDFSGTIVIEKDNNDAKFMVLYKGNDSDSWTEISNWVTYFEYTGDGQLFINIFAGTDNDRDITPDDAIKFGINCFIKNTPNEVKAYPQYGFSVIGQGKTYYDEPDIILRKNRRYKITFDGVLATNTQSGEILNISARNVDNPEEGISIAYRTVDNTSIPSTYYISTPYDCYIRHNSNLTKDSYLNITIEEVPTSIEKAVKQVTSDADKINLLINNLKCKQFLEGDLVTEVSDKLVFGAGISIDKGGEFYIGIMWAENTAGEQNLPKYNAGLIIGNILDPYGTKQRYVAANYGDVIVDNIGYDGLASELIAKKINNTEVAVFATGYYLSGITTAATRIFNLNTKTFGDFQKCYLNITSGGSEYRFQMRSNEADMLQIHQLIGIHNWNNVPAIRGNDYGYYAGNNPIKIGDYFYVFLNIGAYVPALVRTQDFIDFYFVCELPFGKNIDGKFLYSPTEEVALAYMNNRLYASSRGNKGRFTGVTEGVDYYGYNQIMCANFDDVLAGTAEWKVIDLEPYWYEKPSMVAWNNQIYLLTGGVGNWVYKSVEGKNLTRYKHMLFVFDCNLNVIKKELLNPDDGWLHPTFEKFSNSVYSVNHTDMRNYMYEGTGNNRSELRLKRLDMQLLGM